MRVRARAYGLLSFVLWLHLLAKYTNGTMYSNNRLIWLINSSLTHLGMIHWIHAIKHVRAYIQLVWTLVDTSGTPLLLSKYIDTIFFLSSVHWLPVLFFVALAVVDCENPQAYPWMHRLIWTVFTELHERRIEELDNANMMFLGKGYSTPVSLGLFYALQKSTFVWRHESWVMKLG